MKKRLNLASGIGALTSVLALSGCPKTPSDSHSPTGGNSGPFIEKENIPVYETTQEIRRRLGELPMQYFSFQVKGNVVYAEGFDASYRPAIEAVCSAGSSWENFKEPTSLDSDPANPPQGIQLEFKSETEGVRIFQLDKQSELHLSKDASNINPGEICLDTEALNIKPGDAHCRPLHNANIFGAGPQPCEEGECSTLHSLSMDEIDRLVLGFAATESDPVKACQIFRVLFQRLDEALEQ